MNILAITMLVILQLSPVRGARMPHDTILGIRFDMLRREAQLVLGRKQAVLELAANELPRPAAQATPQWGGQSDLLPSSPDADAGYSVAWVDNSSPSPRQGRPVRHSIPGVKPSEDSSFLGHFLFQFPPTLLVR